MLTLQQSIEKQADHLTCSLFILLFKNKGIIFVSSIMLIESMLLMSRQHLRLFRI